MSSFDKKNKVDEDVTKMWEAQLRKDSLYLEDGISFEQNPEGFKEDNETGFSDLLTEMVFNPDFDAGDTETLMNEEPIMVVRDEECHKKLRKMHGILEAFYKGKDVTKTLLNLDKGMNLSKIQQLLMDLMNEWSPRITN